MSKPERISIRPDATYLITGGLGGIGLVIARWLVSRGARHLILAGRNALRTREEWDEVASGTIEGDRITAIRGLESLGANVQTVAVDMGNETSVTELICQCLRADQPPLRGRVSRRRSDAVRTAEQSDSGADARRSGRENGGWMAPASIIGGCSVGPIRALLVVFIAFEFAHDGKLFGRQRVP